ncbi:MAG: hemolysin family protein [Planctomycetia bacterium]|nr:hemolysin family protein [Planctomycetia bacterium]
MWTLFLGSLAIALCVSCLCSLLEAALLSLTPGQIEEMAIKHPRRAKVWRGFKENIDEPISVILILNTSAHTIGATIAGSQFSKICGENEWYITLFSIVFTYVMLQFTEIMPKTVGVRCNRLVAGSFTGLLTTMIVFLRPVIFFVRFMNRPFEAKGSSGISTMDELSALVRLAGVSRLIDKNQVRILEETSKLRKRTAREVMIPVDQITFLSTNQTIEGAVITVHLDPHTRFPLMEGANVHSIVGYVNFKDLIGVLRTNPKNPTLSGIARKVHFIDESEKLTDVLKVFVNEHAHIAIVRNAKKETLGLITMEDIVEELVGDLEDEFDTRLPNYVHPLGNHVFIVGGGAKLTEVLTLLNLDPQLAENENISLSAWLLNQFGTLPAPGKICTFHAWDFVVRRIRREKIFDVNILPVGETFLLGKELP